MVTRALFVARAEQRMLGGPLNRGGRSKHGGFLCPWQARRVPHHSEDLKTSMSGAKETTNIAPLKFTTFSLEYHDSDMTVTKSAISALRPET